MAYYNGLLHAAKKNALKEVYLTMGLLPWPLLFPWNFGQSPFLSNAANFGINSFILLKKVWFVICFFRSF